MLNIVSPIAHATELVLSPILERSGPELADEPSRPYSEAYALGGKQLVN